MKTRRNLRTKKLGSLIEKLRLKKGLNVKELANKIKINPAYLTQIEHSVRLPSPAVMGRIMIELCKDSSHHVKALRNAYQTEKYPKLADLDEMIRKEFKEKLS